MTYSKIYTSDKSFRILIMVIRQDNLLFNVTYSNDCVRDPDLEVLDVLLLLGQPLLLLLFGS